MFSVMCSFARKNEIIVTEKIIIDSVERLGRGDTISYFAPMPLSPLFLSTGVVWSEGWRRTLWHLDSPLLSPRCNSTDGVGRGASCHRATWRRRPTESLIARGECPSQCCDHRLSALRSQSQVDRRPPTVLVGCMLDMRRAVHQKAPSKRLVCRLSASRLRFSQNCSSMMKSEE